MSNRIGPLKWCRDCRSLHRAGEHHPTWHVWVFSEGPDEGSDVRAYDGLQAAARYAEFVDADDDDHLIAKEERVLRVCVAAEGEPEQQFMVTGRTEPVYSARFLNEDERASLR